MRALEDDLPPDGCGEHPDKRQHLNGVLPADPRGPILRDGSAAEIRELILMNRVMMQQMMAMSERVVEAWLMHQLGPGILAAASAAAAATQVPPKVETAPTIMDPDAASACVGQRAA